MKYFITILTITFLGLSVNAQEIISSQKAKRVKDSKGGMLHAHESAVIQKVNYNKVNIYKDGKKVGNQNFNKKVNGFETKSIETIYNEKGITRVFAIELDQKIELYTQQYDTEYNPIGNEAKFADLEKNPDNFQVIGYSANYDEKTRNLLLAINLYYKEGKTNDQLKLFLFDDTFQEMNSIQAMSSTKNSSFEVIETKVLSDDKAVFVISEFEGEITSYGTLKNIIAYNMITFSQNGEPKINAILPDQNRIMKFKISDNVFDDKVLIAIQSQNNTDKSDNKPKDPIKRFLGVYSYDFKSNEMTRKSYALEGEFTNDLVGIKEIEKITYDKEGAIYYIFNNAGSNSRNDYGVFVIKCDDQGDFSWITKLSRKDIGGPKYNFNGHLIYLNDHNEIEMVFNSQKRVFKTGTYKPRTKNSYWFYHIMKESKKTIPVKAKVNSNSGELNVQRILQNEKVNSMSIKQTVETKESGVYYVLHNIEGKTVVSLIDFKGK